MKILASTFLLACAGGMPFTCCAKVPPDEPPTRRLSVAFPYHASPQRREQVLSRYGGIQTGMTAEQVQAALGEPDAIGPIYGGTADNPRTGWMYLYLIQRLEAVGSVGSVQERSVKVHFGNDWTVRGVDTIGQIRPLAPRNEAATTSAPRPAAAPRARRVVLRQNRLLHAPEHYDGWKVNKRPLAIGDRGYVVRHRTWAGTRSADSPPIVPPSHPGRSPGVPGARGSEADLTVGLGDHLLRGLEHRPHHVRRQLARERVLLTGVK